ncbi:MULTISPECIES: SDR family oxidoreductase [Lysobacter]|jgi:NAD(P)-dependent dehydrogenase (short-subunit alcohol dehydrogenase family)|uniref:SDR family oxidoreductase n=1 Tax=Lysobacter gummosus TaxID=262324 RepID=A0ABY3XEL8_9GAMM|nr:MULTISPECIES: SDR family oxidoreductase [Lysobacter]ALN89280.1 short chain dehydrogenase family protein [Lysobacter gummosus]UJB18796.1 SDR family oxidoreductase [Lysobacter capsici]UJQ27479.1 SDR family oxidoreductase [Lysobacter gummosus]UNP29960.1 SDR family oxidoreductase [Lysobacter gummosus]
MSDSNSPAAAPGQRLAGKCVLVSGSSNGIGAAIAKLFVAHGARVAGYDRAPPPDGQTSPCEFFAAGDVADADAVAAFVRDAAQRLGGIDAVINNAGVDVFSDPLTLAQDDWWRNLAINLGGAWNFSRAALPVMLAQGRGSVVNIASVHGHKIIPGAFPYPVAKHALIGLTKALGLEYAAQGLRFNSISPGLILTDRIERWLSSQPDPDAARRRQTELLPPRRIGEPDEVAYTALFLASDEARFINATDIVIDGGRTQLYHE